MQVHFYTNFENYQEIKLFGKGTVWNKSEAKKTDIHVSFDIEKYYISQHSADNECVFTVGLIEASTNW